MSEYHLVIECPETGKAVRTGVVLTQLSAFEALAVESRPVACPHCSRTHVWSKRDAWVEVAARE